ncbi:MAG: peptide chain release factor H [Hyphomicrobiaceae bacterium]
MTIRLLATSGRGPAECRIALAKVLETMTNEAASCGLDLDIVTSPGGDVHGPASAIAIVRGDAARTFARRWLGSILWVAPSPVRPHHKRKNWFVGVLELPPLKARATTIQPTDIRYETFRAGGPGGQHQNKTESAVRAIHVPTGLAVVSRDARSQHRNKSVALERLTALLASAADLTQKGDRHETHATHDSLERGNPTRRFTSPSFIEG